MRKVLFLCLLTVGYASCRRLAESRLQTQTVQAAGIAIVYLGHDNCRRYLQQQGRSAAEIAQVIDRNASFGRYITHLVDGDNGELITAEFMRARRNNELQFSGDRFLQKHIGNEVSIAQIESNCRRLLLRIDATVATPTLELLAGTTSKREQDKALLADFGSEWGAASCVKGLCTLSQLANATRYLSYLLPNRDEHIKVRVRWCSQLDCDQARVETLTVRGIAP